MYFRARGTNKLRSTYHYFPHYDNARKELESAGEAQRDVAWSESDQLGHARAGLAGQQVRRFAKPSG
jgi:hypothetical protein